MIHAFHTPIDTLEPPSQFTYPFYYTPHPLCVRAAEEVQAYLASRTDWQEELQQGKMFGVLVVETAQGELGYLAAFSGILAGSNRHPFFVPPIYDLLQPDGFFRIEEEQISALNREVKHLQDAPEGKELLANLQRLKAEADKALEAAKTTYKAAKKEREARRNATHHPGGPKEEMLTEEEREAMIRESQFQKAELKRLERRWKTILDSQQAAVNSYQERINALKQERKQRSATLQRQLFAQFILRNARGETLDLCRLFHETIKKDPPAGAGECAAPKLLQYAYLHHLRPVCMAEFWWGHSPKQEVRHHGCYYPACQSKCGPILGFMLQGLPVEANPLAEDRHRETPLEILYEDETICVVNKPASLLSVPGKGGLDSVYRRMQLRYPQATGPLIVHRLDMDTSGLLLIAKSLEAYHHLQEQFTHRKVEKRYLALLDGHPAMPQGLIDLPLRPDLHDRPRQVADREHGKQALTRYEVLERRGTQTLVAFYPLTGRTHQLRVHAAHPEGLHCPIHGDALYGHHLSPASVFPTTPDCQAIPGTRPPACSCEISREAKARSEAEICNRAKAEVRNGTEVRKRLCLHAESLRFTHPSTGQEMTLQCPADFK